MESTSEGTKVVTSPISDETRKVELLTALEASNTVTFEAEEKDKDGNQSKDEDLLPLLAELEEDSSNDVKELIDLNTNSVESVAQDIAQCRSLRPAEWCQECGRLTRLHDQNANSLHLTEDGTSDTGATSAEEMGMRHLPGCQFYNEQMAIEEIVARQKEDTIASSIKGEVNTAKNIEELKTMSSLTIHESFSSECVSDSTEESFSADVPQSVATSLQDQKVMQGTSNLGSVIGSGNTGTADQTFIKLNSSNVVSTESDVDHSPKFICTASNVNTDTINTISNPLVPYKVELCSGTNVGKDVTCNFSIHVHESSPVECKVNVNNNIYKEGTVNNDDRVQKDDCGTLDYSKSDSDKVDLGDSSTTVKELEGCEYNIKATEQLQINDEVSGLSNISDENSDTKKNVVEPDSCVQFQKMLRDTDKSEISCGFSSLGSALFQKCKYKRESTPLSSENDLSKPCSELQPCSVADTPLYISENKESSVRSPDIDAEFLSAKLSTQNTEISKSESSFIRPISGRRLGVFNTQSNPCILEETEEIQDSQTMTCQHKITSEKVPSYREVKSEIITTTSAPCSPVPQQSSPDAYSSERKRKLNTCVRRRVSFPEDDQRLITSYLEPVDPWERMKKTVSSDEVLGAYLNSCSTHRCSPIPGVLSQIAALPLSIPGRVECLSLRNCKLELNQCEGLEEILKRVQFVTIDLEGCSLSDDTIIPLLDMIEFYDSATQINISCNTHIGNRGWYACTRMLKKNQSIRYLDARSTNLNEYNMPILGRALKAGAKLHTLHLENCNLTGKPLVNLAAALKVNDTLVKLYLADNRLGSNDCIQIGNLMKSNLTLKLLDLRNNNLQDAGCEHVCEGVAEQNNMVSSSPTSPDKSITSLKTRLNSLVLWNNHMTVNCALHIASMMLYSRSLETLNIGRNNITNDGIIRLKESLLRNKSLKRLYLHATKIGDEGAVALAEIIAETKTIERIDIRDNNNIKVAGLLALAHSLPLNTSVVQMDIDTKPESEPLSELSEQHTNLLREIKECTHRNRMAAHVSAAEASAGDEYQLDPDFRKLSLTSEIESDVEKTVAEVPPHKTGHEEHKKYRSPSPSPCPSPTPSQSPSMSPAPSPVRGRFTVTKVSAESSLSPISSPVVSMNPLLSSSLLNVSSTAAMSSSAPASSISVISTTSRPIYQSPQPKTNRFLRKRFTVTKVSTDIMPGSSAPNKSKSVSLPHISQNFSAVSGPSSPKIVISSPVKVERGFSVDETVSESQAQKSSEHPTSLARSESESKSDISTRSNDELSKIYSSEMDDVFVDSLSGPISSVGGAVLRRSRSAIMESVGGSGLGPIRSSRRELTDSGFLEEASSEFEDALSNLASFPTGNSTQDGDRDSLFSNTSDTSGHSPLHSESKVKFGSANSLMKSVESTPKAAAPHPKPRCVGAVQRAPLATMENGSFDTDSEDSELTTQSSDSTHSDEVKIVSEDLTPQQAWCVSKEGVQVTLDQPFSLSKPISFSPSNLTMEKSPQDGPSH